MKIGIVSDTHNNIKLTQKALGIFRERGITMVLHAGDFTSPRMLRLFKNFDCKFIIGNGDIDTEELNAESIRLEFGPIGEKCVFELEGKKFILFHGNDVPRFRETVASGIYDYIIKGHTHFFENYTSGKTRVINPGCLYTGSDCSVAILDTKTDKVEMIRIEEE